MARIRGVAIGLVPIVSMAFAQSVIAGKSVRHFAQDGWRLVVRHDGFVQSTTCSLVSKNGRILFQPTALGFRFANKSDTLQAFYRIDGGPPRRWQDRYPALIASGTQMDGTSLDAPTDGIVWLPIDEVATARMVSIRLDNKERVRSFALRGFAPMLAAARRLGCTDNAGFTS